MYVTKYLIDNVYFKEVDISKWKLFFYETLFSTIFKEQILQVWIVIFSQRRTQNYRQSNSILLYTLVKIFVSFSFLLGVKYLREVLTYSYDCSPCLVKKLRN